MVKISQLGLFLSLAHIFMNTSAGYVYKTEDECFYVYSKKGKFISDKLPGLFSGCLKKSVSLSNSEHIFIKRLKNATERGSMYSYLRSQQKYKHFYYNSSVTFLPILDSNKESRESLAQYVGYVAGDMVISETADRLATLGPVKGILQSSPVKYVSDNISEEHKSFFKDQLIFATSATLINGAYQLSEKSQDATLYNKNGAAQAIGGAVAINGLDHFIVKKYISKDWREYSPVISYCIGTSLIGVVESLSQKK